MRRMCARRTRPSASARAVERELSARRRDHRGGSATGADAIHPGYGFLSEREWFARAVRDAGLVWIGPPAEAIAAVGSKTAARDARHRERRPVVPGTTEALRDADEAAESPSASAIRCC